MKLKENIAVSESGFLFDPNTGESFSVNSSGKRIMKLLSEKKTLQEIEETILSEFEISSEAFNRFMDDFAHTLRRFNLLENEIDE